jgi:hypothetical protein
MLYYPKVVEIPVYYKQQLRTTPFCHVLYLGMHSKNSALWCRRSRIHRYVAAPLKHGGRYFYATDKQNGKTL